jgi:apolipoprotein D and lipocalin family protein
MPRYLLAATLIIASVPLDATAPQHAPLRVVPEVDYQRYAGTWYEIARLPNRFQRACASDVTATYALRSNARIAVTNRCRQADGDIREANGVARRVEGQPPSVLKVRFAPALLSFLPFVWGDYHLIELGADYDYAVVGTPDRSYLWILARGPEIDRELYQGIVDRVREQGFDVSALIPTAHTEVPSHMK